MSLLKKMKAASTTKTASILAESDFFNNTFKIPTRIPALNIALGGSVHAGVVPGLTIFAADSKHFKTNFCLQMVSAFLNSDPDAVCLFYDSEFGVTPAYLKSMDVDPERVLHIPITNVEELKFDVVKKLEAIERGEKVIIFVDSVGNLASKKELEDAINEKSVADMSRAKSLKSLFRIVTPYLTTKNIPMLVVNHVYADQSGGLYAKDIMSGGKGPMLSANTVFFISKSQDKDNNELKGFHFKLIVEKSRFVREKSVIPITVSFDNGIEKWSGMFDIAKNLGWIISPNQGWYSVVNPHTGEVYIDRARAKALQSDDAMWNKILEEGLNDDIMAFYQLGGKFIEHPDDSEEESQIDE